MHKILTATEILFVIALVCPEVFCAQTSVRLRTEKPRPAVSISVDKAEFLADEEVVLDFKLKNQSRIPIFLQVPYLNGHLCRIIITDQKSKEEILLKYPRGPWRQVWYRPVRIDPSYFYGKSISVGKLSAGKYLLKVRYDSHPATAQRGVWTGSILSNEVSIYVKEAPVASKAVEPAFIVSGTRIVRRDSVGDGKIDTISRYVGKRLAYLSRDRNGDGKADLWQDFKRSITVWDSDYNDIPDTWYYFKKGAIFRTGYDTDGDGRPDTFESE